MRFTNYKKEKQSNFALFESGNQDEILYPNNNYNYKTNKELEELEIRLFLHKVLDEEDELYFDEDKNIIVKKNLEDFDEEEKLNQDYKNIEKYFNNLEINNKQILETNEFEIKNFQLAEFTLVEPEAESSNTRPQSTNPLISPFRASQNIPYRNYQSTAHLGQNPRIIPTYKPQEYYNSRYNKGKRLELEQPIKFQTIGKPQILNLTAHDPQLWTNVIEVWKQTLIADCITNMQGTEVEELFNYLESFLGEAVKAQYDVWKQSFPNDYAELIKLGTNPWNWVNKISNIITGKDPNSGLDIIQQNALTRLEQVSLYKWDRIKEFLNEYVYYTSIVGMTFNQDIGDKLFRKLPGPLGQEIIKRWNESAGVIKAPNNLWSIGSRVQHIIDVVTEKCTNIQIQTQIKKPDYAFCKTIYTPQTYGL